MKPAMSLCLVFLTSLLSNYVFAGPIKCKNGETRGFYIPNLPSNFKAVWYRDAEGAGSAPLFIVNSGQRRIPKREDFKFPIGKTPNFSKGFSFCYVIESDGVQVFGVVQDPAESAEVIENKATK